VGLYIHQSAGGKPF